jgi:hypothetical protein
VVNEVNVTITGSPTVALAGFEDGSFGSGQIVLYGTGANLNQTLDVWCIDATHVLFGSDTYQIVYPTTNNGNTGGTNSTLTSTVLGEIGALVKWGDANINKYDGVSAAVQLAIWTIEYHGATFTSDSSVVNYWVPKLVTDAETAAPGFAAFYGLGEVVDPSTPSPYPSYPGFGNQGLVYVASTPLPSTWTMMLVGVAALGLLAFRRPKRSAALSIT